MKKLLFSLILSLFACASFASAQPRQIENTSTKSAVKTAAPVSFAAKYEGGMFGFADKETGTLKLDDANERLVFFSKEGKELFAMPYETLSLIYPQSQSVRSTTGTVVSAIPLPGAGLAGLIREKRRYLVVHFNDTEVDARGIVNFKLNNKELLDSLIQTLGEKAKLTQRGDAFYRPKKTPATEL
ncbi:MAG TPA: hypothetical protein VK308_04175 [Pyrinomonadaceae bacterium]|jgi:hypothetical protein|nr:hypothetical protein [Pyrinomonadaceae bacterium]